MTQPEPAVSRRFGAVPSSTKSHLPQSATEFGGFLPLMSNTTYTPNQFFDVCLPHCSRSTIRLVGYFLRRTLGWCDQFGRPQEDQIEISFRELAAKSGVGRDRLRTALDDVCAPLAWGSGPRRRRIFMAVNRGWNARHATSVAFRRQ